MRRGEREEEKGGEAGARQGSRIGVLIKKTQIAAQQMIFFSFFTRHKTVVGGDQDCWRYLVQNLSRQCKCRRGGSSRNNFNCCVSVRGCECLGDKSIPCSKLAVNVILKVHFQIHLCNL